MRQLVTSPFYEAVWHLWLAPCGDFHPACSMHAHSQVHGMTEGEVRSPTLKCMLWHWHFNHAPLSFQLLAVASSASLAVFLTFTRPHAVISECAIAALGCGLDSQQLPKVSCAVLTLSFSLFPLPSSLCVCEYVRVWAHVSV